MINIEIRKSKKCNGQDSMFLSFNYDEKVVSYIRQLPDRYWDKDKKEWEVPVKKLSDLLNTFPEYEFDITAIYTEEKKDHKVPEGFEFKTKPFEHQIAGFTYGLNNDKWLLGDEQGLGKTKQAIDIAVAKKLERGYKHCLIICGVNGLKWNWCSEIKIHSNEGAHILGQHTVKGKTVVGGNADKLADLKAIDDISEYFIIVNIECLRNPEILSHMTKLCKNKTIGMIVCDEIHKMKNPSSQQGKSFLKLQAETMIAMTGTPLLNNPLDLYIILRWLGFENHSFYSFKNHYCIMGGYGGYEVISYQHLEDLQEQLNDIMLRRRKEDVLDLPEKLRVNEYVEMTPKQSQIYSEIKNELKANIDRIKQSNNPLAELIRMRQATGYTGILSSTIQESAKLDRMEELVEDAVANGKKVVIFSNWTQMTDEIYKRLHPKYHPAIITGQTPDETRQDEVWHFQNDNNCKVIIGTTGAMGTGLTLTAGTVEIFMDEPWNQASKEQAEDRCHRVGTKENVTIYTLICKNTIDERVHELVEKKGHMANMLVDGKVLDKEKLVDYLLD